MILLAVGIAVGLSACGGEEGGGGSGNIPEALLQPTNFDIVYERQLSVSEAEGLLASKVQAKEDSTGNVHIVFFTSGESLDTTGLPPGSDLADNPFRFLIHYGVWSPVTQQLVGSEEIITTTTPYTNDSPAESGDQGIDNTYILRLALNQGNIPMVVFQGGARPQSQGGLTCNAFFQGDLMVALPNGGVWEDYLGIQGDASNKNPLFTDGQMGVHGDIVVDSSGMIHMIAQHYYEACDLHGITFPDLLYVQQELSDLGYFQTSMEEYVDEYNTYGAGGGIQNMVGDHCRLVLDPADQPVAFYFAFMTDGSRVIRISRRVAGQWQPETVTEIDDEYEVGHLSPAIAADGTMSVAYFLRRISEEADLTDHLCYAQREETGDWNITMVDYASYCGNYCTLALDNNQQPVIVYYDEMAYVSYRERHDLKMAYFNNQEWRKETVYTDGDIGVYNSIWFDAENRINVCTYEQEGNKILILRRRL